MRRHLRREFRTREKTGPEYESALADLRPADALTVTMFARLGRSMVELIASAQELAERDHCLEIHSGPVSGSYDPQGRQGALRCLRSPSSSPRTGG
ncbi:recombinase family protein [Streptomyces nojiriensis]|uniref:recombinase family protein n=1 Tax=Streptomyces nojiriensis TaxID=66374 RepID=UPI0036D7EBBA